MNDLEDTFTPELGEYGAESYIEVSFINHMTLATIVRTMHSLGIPLLNVNLMFLVKHKVIGWPAV